MPEDEVFEFGRPLPPRKPFVRVTVEYLDGTFREFHIGEDEAYWGWRLNEDQQLVFKRHRYTNRTVVPLANLRSYDVFRSDAKRREVDGNG